MVSYIRSLFASGTKPAHRPAPAVEKSQAPSFRKTRLEVERLEERISPSSMAFLHHKQY
jgi:hypothetical protein